MTPNDTAPNDHDHREPSDEGGDRKPRFEIFVNLREVHVEHDVLTFEEVIALAPNLPAGADVTFIVKFSDAVGPRHEGTVTSGHTVRVKNGTRFSVRVTRKS